MNENLKRLNNRFVGLSLKQAFVEVKGTGVNIIPKIVNDKAKLNINLTSSPQIFVKIYQQNSFTVIIEVFDYYRFNEKIIQQLCYPNKK